MDKPYKRLLAWQKGMDLVVEVYELSKSFPREERYGLTSQVRRASISVPSNIAEGAAGRSITQFRNFLSIAMGSLNEISTQLEIAYRLGYLEKGNLAETESRVDQCLALTTVCARVSLKKTLSSLFRPRLTAYCLLDC